MPIWQQFNQNCTFVIKNYITGVLLYDGHLSIRRADKICDSKLWQGTAKSAEDHLSEDHLARKRKKALKLQ